MRHNVRSQLKQAGLGIIEIMVAITIGLLILAGVVQLYASSSSTQLSQEGNSRIQENLRFLMASIEEDFNVTGYAGCFPLGANDPESPQRIDNKLGFQANPAQPFNFNNYVDGFNDTGPGSNPSGSDRVVIRFASYASKIPVVSPMANTGTVNDQLVGPFQIDTMHPAYSLLRQYQVVILSDCTRATIFMITNDPQMSGGFIEHVTGMVAPAGSLNPNQFNVDDEFLRNYGELTGSTPAFLYAGSTGYHEYDLNVSAVGNAAGGACIAATPEYCALFRDGIELVEGVEDFQVEYGYKQPVLVRPGYSENTGDLIYCDASTCPNMTWVDRVKITVTINSVQPAPTNTGTQLIKRTFSRVINIRNKLPMG